MKRLQRNRWATAMAAAGTLSLHALLIAPLVLGDGASRASSPEIAGGSMGANASADESASTLVLLDLTSTTLANDDSPLSLSLQEPTAPDLSLLIADAREPAVFSEGDTNASQDKQKEGDMEGYAHLFGRYLGQVSARVERAWRRPRTSIGAGRFSCEARIDQDMDGKVRSIELHNCNGDGRWQQSLVSAIESASPLSVPPDPALFTNTLVLHFSSYAYVAGSSTEDMFEPLPRTTNYRVADAQPQGRPEPDTTYSTVAPRSNDIALQIVGSKVTWSVREPVDLQQKTVQPTQ